MYAEIFRFMNFTNVCYLIFLIFWGKNYFFYPRHSVYPHPRPTPTTDDLYSLATTHDIFSDTRLTQIPLTTLSQKIPVWHLATTDRVFHNDWYRKARGSTMKLPGWIFFDNTRKSFKLNLLLVVVLVLKSIALQSVIILTLRRERPRVNVS